MNLPASLRAVIDRLCRHLYTLALLLFLLVAGFAPVQSLGTRHADIARVLPGNRVLIEGALDGLEVGARVPVYRFNPGWRQEIGHVVVVEAGPGRAVASYDPTRFLWPMGIQGKVTSVEGRMAELDIGADVGLTVRQRVNVYEGYARMGSLAVVSVSGDRARARVLGGRVAAGQIASIYIVKNRIAWMPRGPIYYLSYGLLSGVLALFAWSVVSEAPGRALASSVAALKGAAGAAPLPLRLAGHALLGVPVAWVVGQLGFWSFTYVLAKLVALLRARGLLEGVRTLPAFPSEGSGYVQAALGIAYALYLLRYQRSPVAAAWRALGYRPLRLRWLPVPDYLVYWALNLVVFYAFTSTLSEVITGNLRVLSGFGWGHLGLRFEGFRGTVSSVVTMLANPPRVRSIAEGFTIARYVVWSSTIAVCLVLYWHTVVSLLWKRPLRGVDFTPTGWVVNAVCYGPLLGGVVHHMVPQVDEVFPVVAAGPWPVLTLAVELLLNVLYAASIFNLGTMFGVMVDKGVRRAGFYSVVRHPSYTLEAAMFVMLFLPGLATPAHWLFALAFFVKYWVRSERDDVFMAGSNPDYLAYRAEVPWKFIRGVY
jgi:hypothetical protein